MRFLNLGLEEALKMFKNQKRIVNAPVSKLAIILSNAKIHPNVSISGIRSILEEYKNESIEAIPIEVCG